MKEEKNESLEKVGSFVSSTFNKIVNLIIFLIIVGLIVIIGWFWHNSQLDKQRMELLEKQNMELKEELEGSEGADLKFEKVEEEIGEFENKEIKLEKGQILFVGKYDNQKNQTTIFSFDSKTNEQEEISFIKGGIRKDNIAYYKNNIYFIDDNNELEKLDLSNNKQEILNLGFDNNTKLNGFENFIISESKAFYLRDVQCGFKGECLLGYYDISTSTNKIVSEYIGDLRYGVVSLVSFDNLNNKLRISASFGDAGVVSITFYDFDLNNKVLKKLDEAKYSSECFNSDVDDKDFYHDNYIICSEEEKVERKKYEDLVDKFGKKLSCGGEGTDDIFQNLQKLNNATTNYTYVGCIE